jgi:hypothetical protein
MNMRTTREIVNFSSSFSLEDAGRVMPAGSYQVVTDEELIEGLSFPAYRRIATSILVPAQSYQGSVEMVTVDPLKLAAAQARDAAAASNSIGGLSAKAQ